MGVSLVAIYVLGHADEATELIVFALLLKILRNILLITHRFRFIGVDSMFQIEVLEVSAELVLLLALFLVLLVREALWFALSFLNFLGVLGRGQVQLLEILLELPLSVSLMLLLTAREPSWVAVRRVAIAIAIAMNAFRRHGIVKELVEVYSARQDRGGYGICCSHVSSCHLSGTAKVW